MWYSIAISFKYFAALAYLPLVLLIEKRLIYLVFYGVLGLAVTAIQFALYWHSDIFVNEILGLALEKTVGKGVSMRALIANGCYLGMCAYIYFSKFNFNEEASKWQQRAILTCIASYALFFSWVLWHPQWIILITPFVCISLIFVRSKKLFQLILAIDILGYVGFIIYTMNNWVGNVDNTMLYGGVFGGLLPHTNILVADLVGRRWMGLSRTLFYTSIWIPFIVVILERRTNGIIYFSSGKNNYTLIKLLIRLRLLVACYFVIVITATCFMSP